MDDKAQIVVTKPDGTGTSEVSFHMLLDAERLINRSGALVLDYLTRIVSEKFTEELKKDKVLTKYISEDLKKKI